MLRAWTYDEAGNLKAVGGTSRTFSYDGENRITTAAVNGVNGGYTYDGDGQRVQKTVSSGNGPVTTTYVYDAWGNLAAEYTNDTSSASVCGTATYYLTMDHLGSTRMVTDSSGNVKARSVQACAATPACTLPSDIIGNFLREDDLILNPLVYEAGHVNIPEGNGLGVELDLAAVEKYCVDHRVYEN